jgi:molecular chaperone HtpG
VFIEYGMISDEKFYERAEKFCLLKNTDNKYFTFEEYKNHIKTLQTDKEKDLVYLYTNNLEEQHSFIQAATERGYDVLLLDGVIDSHFVNVIEQKFDKSKFTRVDADIIDKLILKEDAMPSKLSEEQQKELKPVIEKYVEKEKFTVQFESMSENDQPFLITQPEYMRRMKDMSAMGGGMSFYGSIPDSYNLVINSNHPLVTKIMEEKDEAQQASLIKQATDLAMLSQNLLKGEKLTEFIKRSVEIIK